MSRRKLRELLRAFSSHSRSSQLPRALQASLVSGWASSRTGLWLREMGLHALGSLEGTEALLRSWGSPLSQALLFHSHLPGPISALTRPQEEAQPHQRLCYLLKPHSSSSPAQGHFPLIAVWWEGGWGQEVQTACKVTRAAGWASPKISQTQPCFISAEVMAGNQEEARRVLSAYL